MDYYINSICTKSTIRCKYVYKKSKYLKEEYKDDPLIPGMSNFITFLCHLKIIKNRFLKMFPCLFIQ